MTFLIDPKTRRENDGMALVLVLCCLVIVSALVVSFLLAAQVEVQASSMYQASAATQQLTDTTVNLVEAEITAATSVQPPGMWASQPGAIWNFDKTGTPSSIYRLYSWSSAVANSGNFVTTDLAAIPTTRASSPAFWTDLNQESTTGRFPIVDPTTTIDGFTFNSAPGGNVGPMPSQWLYVLANGSIVSPTVGGDTSTAVVAGASTTNPIVGRIAYWTDDETCKVDVNTAGGDDGGTAPVLTGGVANQATYSAIAGATFWDTPHFNGAADINFGSSQPVQNEFQRYPGHPGTVALNYLLSSLTGSNLSSLNFYSLTPRYSYGGSKGGTVAVNSSQTAIANTANRLLPSVDELLFQPSSRGASIINSDTTASSQTIDKARFFLTARSVAPELNLYGEPRVSMWPVAYEPSETLTASSPVPTDASHITAIDQTLSLCSTLVSGANAYPYYFSRTNANSSTVDITIPRNGQLLTYLDTLTSASAPGNQVPGFGSGNNFQTKYPVSTGGSRQILAEMFDYIRSINSLDPTLPTGENGSTILYPVNSFAAGTPSSGNVLYQGISVGIGQIVPSYQATWKTSGFGVFPRLVEADLQFVGLGYGNTNTATAPYTNVPNSALAVPANDIPTATAGRLNNISTTGVPPPNTVALQAYLLLNFVNPAHTFPWMVNEPAFFVEAKGLNGMKIQLGPTGSSVGMGFTSDDVAVGGAIKYSFLAGGPQALTGLMDFRGMVAGRTLGPGLSAPSVTNYPFYSDIIAVTNSMPGISTNYPMTCNGLSGLTIKIYAPSNLKYSNAQTQLLRGALVQTYTLNFPQFSSPVPGVGTLRHVGSASGVDVNGNISTNLDRWIDPILFGGSIANNYVSTAATSVIQATNNTGVMNTVTALGGNDVIQGLTLSSAYSDARMLAITNVPAAAFTTAPGYGSSQLAWGLTVPFLYVPGGTGGTLVAGTSGVLPAHSSSAAGLAGAWPLVPPTISAATMSDGSLGDFDNGIGSFPDGPYINKSDEGDVAPQIPLNYLSYYTWNQFGSVGTTYFSPNRQIPSPGMFGSLPTGVDITGASPKPWQTLDFRPPPGSTGYTGFNTLPRDEMFLDLFWMPVTDPYPMSEEFATTGKVNMNYEIVPFTYITRSTAMRAALAGEEVAGDNFSTANAATYKVESSGSNTLGVSRLALNLGADSGTDGGVMQQFRDMFGSSGSFFGNTQPMIFRSPAQICEIWLTPKGHTWSSLSSAQSDWYGSSFALVGDNVRERPYTDIYGKLTTKSNSYKIYYTVQALKATATDLAAGQWNEKRGSIVSQYVGSTAIERYLDPSATIPDYAASATAAATAPNMDAYYRWRVTDNRQFTP